jgi:DNA polymerase elongation subunit (family B)
MAAKLPLDRILYLDIETVSQYQTYAEIPEAMKPLWKLKAGRFAKQMDEEWTEEIAAQLYSEKAALYAEFGKIAVISVGFALKVPDGYQLKLKSFASTNEMDVLNGFSALITSHYNNPNKQFLCGHNIREFDIPFLCRRMVISGLQLPEMIDVTGKKPWETKHFVDTMELWRFGEFRNYTSLNMLANVLDVLTPKDDIDGSDVGRVFWEENDLERIAVYCEKDVATCARVLFRLQGEPSIPDEKIEHVK